MISLTENINTDESLPSIAKGKLAEVLRLLLVLVHTTFTVCSPASISVNMCPESPVEKSAIQRSVSYAC